MPGRQASVHGLGTAQVPAEKPEESAAGSWPEKPVFGLEDAILRTVVYADLFDYPLTTQQIHRYLTEYAAPREVVEQKLDELGSKGDLLEPVPPYWVLNGRKHLAPLRLQREAYSEPLWSAVHRYGLLMAALPFVRMTAVTGALAMGNAADRHDDVDLLIVTQMGRVWLARGLVILVVHLARQWGIELCPNYVMAEHKLRLDNPSLYTAHELAQLVPLHGATTYLSLLETNAWICDYLPNATPLQLRNPSAGRVIRGGQRVLEVALSGRLGDAIEGWEGRRKIPLLRQTAAQRGATEAKYTRDLCKGHVDNHEASVAQRYAERLVALGL